MDFEFIDEGDIQGVKRGRKSTVPTELVELFSKVPAGKAIRLTAFAGDPMDEDYKAHKAKHSATIRTAAKMAGVEVKTAWSPTGVPQVTVSASPKKKK